MVSRISRILPKPPALGRLRLAAHDDVPRIMNLLTDSMKNHFRITCAYDVSYLIENSVLTFCALDVNDGLVGCISAREYPLIPSVHPSAWEEYLWTKYKTIELNSRNTLFLHLLCWNPAYAREVVDFMLKSMFMHDAYLMHVGMVKSLTKSLLLVPGQSRSEAMFRRVQAMEKGIQPDQLPGIFIADRTEVSPRLRIRRAVEEDNDDLVPILERHSEKLQEMYGEFYISELIARHPESDRVLVVCEAKELAVGVMCLNTQINFEALEEDYELSPFAGLRRLTEPVDKHSVDLVDSPSFDVSQIYTSCHEGPYMSEARALEKRKSAREDGKSLLEVSFPKAFPPTHLGPSVHLEVINMLKEVDEIEFDIVNIDTDLLRLPRFLSSEIFEAQSITDPKLKKMNNSSQTLSSHDKTKREVKPSLTGMPPETKRYLGEANAFLLELFAIDEDYDERYGFDMLEAAYELFPNRDYCILCIPSNKAPFPLLEHFTLVTPNSFRRRFIKDSLYVAHINSVKGHLKVRPAEAYDLYRFQSIVAHAPRDEMLTELFAEAIDSPIFKAYVFMSEREPVGMVVLGPLEDESSIRNQFELEAESRRPGTDGALLAGVVTPVIEPHFRWLLREMLRQSQYSTIFWMCRLFAKGDMSPANNLMSLVGHMTPVHPRRAIPNITRHKDLDIIYKELATPFALWVIERPLTGMPKVYVNSSIVVIGASRTGLSFLEALLLGPTSSYLTFTNVSLISEHGIPTVAECLKAADICIPKDGRYTDRYLKRIPFYFYFDVIPAVMTSIDRKKKILSLKGGSIKHYDELVLTCGQQFQHPEYLRKPLEIVKEVERGKPCDRMLMDNPKYLPDTVPFPPDMPHNVMIINNLCEANRCLKKLIVMITELKDSAIHLSEKLPIVVYGCYLEVYSCMAALIELGIAPEKILFVEPFPSEDPLQLRVNCFNNEMVDNRVQQNLQGIGIRTFRKTYLKSWRQRNMHVEYLNLMSELHAIRQPCFALFYYGIKAIDVNAFKAINDCGLVYDGGLVVGPAFETNDPHVFGAGTCVKYSRKLYADFQRSHKFFCSEDVGEALAHLFLSKLDPFVIGTTGAVLSDLLPRYNSAMFSGSFSTIGLSSTNLGITSAKIKWQPVMRFESPHVQFAMLPGPLFYLNVRQPGREKPMAVQTCSPHQGHTLLTDKNENYFRLQLNEVHCVNAVTCLSKKPFSYEIMTQLYGKHEAFFNKLYTRFKMNLIDDMYVYFIQPWMSAIYQEPFEDFLRAVNEDKVKEMFDLIQEAAFTHRDFEVLDKINSVPFTCCSQCDIKKNPDCPCSSVNDHSTCHLNRISTVQMNVPERTSSSVVDRFLSYGKRNSSVLMANASSKVDIPSECGQSKKTRDKAAAFWQQINGESVVVTHLAKYLKRNSVTNPQYATIDPDCI